MKIFTERGFQEELNRRREAQEEYAYRERRLCMMEADIEKLREEVEKLKEIIKHSAVKTNGGGCGWVD